MKVKREDHAELVPVGELSDGAAFDYSGVAMLKIFNARLDEKVRAVEYLFSPEAEVVPLDAELIVRGERNEDTSR